MKALHFFAEGLNFPVAIGTYTEWHEVQVSYLAQNIKEGHFNTESICRWCISHSIPYQIIYPISKKVIIKNPYKYYKFLQLKRRLQVATGKIKATG